MYVRLPGSAVAAEAIANRAAAAAVMRMN